MKKKKNDRKREKAAVSTKSSFTVQIKMRSLYENNCFEGCTLAHQATTPKLSIGKTVKASDAEVPQ